MIEKGFILEVNTPWGTAKAVVLDVITVEVSCASWYAVSHQTMLTQDALIKGDILHFRKWEMGYDNPKKVTWDSDVENITLLADGVYVKGITENIKAIEDK